MKTYGLKSIIDIDSSSERFGQILLRPEQPEGLNPYRCIGCNSCSSVCPASGILGMDPQKFIRLIILGQEKVVLNSKWLWLCALCHNCVNACPLNINIPLIIDRARRLQPHNALPKYLRAAVEINNITGNNLGKTPSWFMTVVQMAQKKLNNSPGFEQVTIPIDKKGAGTILFLNMQLLELNPYILHSYTKIFHAAREDWTLSSFAIDTSCPAFLAGDKMGEQLWRDRIVTICKDLGIHTCIIDDCANPLSSFGAGNNIPTVDELPFKVLNSAELIFKYLEQGRLNLRPSILRSTVTFHDPCNVSSPQELFEFPRTLLEFFATDFVELGRTKRDSICCGGTVLAAGNEDALEFGRWKAEQISQSAADLVVVCCQSCYIQIQKLARYYKLPYKSALLTEIVANGLKIDPIPPNTK